MAMTTQDFKTLYTSMVAQVQGTVSRLVDGTVGSLVQALMQACAAQIIWLQGLVLQLLAATRAATSSGSDLDSWMNDYGLTRLPAQAAIWNADFSRFTFSNAALLYPTQTTASDGSVTYTAAVQTQDGSEQYALIIDTTHAAWNQSAGCYVINAGQQTLSDIPLLALTPGLAGGGNGGVQPGQVNTLAQAMPGFDSVSNTSLRQPGADAETDVALRLRFQQYLASLSRATSTAVASAIAAVSPAASYVIVENQRYDGTPDDGFFYVVVDDGTGNPSSQFLGTVSNAVDAVRPLAIRFAVYGPQPLVAAVSLAIQVADDQAAAAIAAVQQALSDYIAGLGLGRGINYTRLPQIAYDASSAVQNVGQIYLNGTAADLVASQYQRYIPWYYTMAAATVATPGSGYTAGDVLTVQGGTETTPATLSVSQVDSNGGILAVAVGNAGNYTVTPADPAAVSGGSGSGARFALTANTVSTITVSTYDH